MSKVLLVGIDAGSRDLLEQWVASGDLPTFKALFSHCATYPVKNPLGLEAGAVWPVFHAAQGPGRQPQYDGRRYFDAATYQEDWYTAAETTPPFWRELSDQGLNCLIVDPPYVPLDPQINGRMVVDWGAHVPSNGRMFDFKTSPPELADDILAHEGPDPAGWQSCDKKSPESIEDYESFFDQYVTRIEKRADLACRLLSDDDWQLALIGSTDLHCTGHHLWHVTDRTHPSYRPELEAALGPALKRCYMAFDASLQRILDAVDQDTTVMVFGSHGMGPQYTGTGLLDRILLSLDHGKPAQRERSNKARLRRLWQRLPINIRARLQVLRKPFSGSLHPPRFLGGRDERRFFEVYANNACGGVRVNLMGREANGKVPPDGYEPLLKDLRAALLEITNAETGEKLADEVFITRELYGGAHIDALPDLLIRWNRTAPIRIAESAKIGRIAQETVDNRTGDHSPDGVLYAYGPLVAATGLQTEIGPADFGPTLARVFGLKLSDADGKAIDGIGQ